MLPFFKGAVAQLVEHHVRNVGVTSSSLVRSTILRSAPYGLSYGWSTTKSSGLSDISFRVNSGLPQHQFADEGANQDANRHSGEYFQACMT